jgi:signal transduction histidine kinase
VVEGLAGAARRIAKNEQTELPQVKGNSEVAQLARSLDDMVRTLESAVTTERNAQEAMKAFIGDASHELRTPLTVIKGYTELLSAKGDDAEFRAKAIDRVSTEVVRMEQLVSDLLLLAQLGEERQLPKVAVDLTKLISDACGDMQTLQPERSVELELQPGVVVTGSGDHLVQLLNNLCSNIQRHTPLDALVRVRLVAADSAAVLTIDDAGPGLSAEVYERGIEGFERFDAFASRQNGGSGLGMTIMRAIVAEHGGKMKLSRSDLGGLRTEISLPL